MDNDLPKKIQPNLILVKTKGNRIYNLSSWLKFLLLNIPKIFKNFDFFLVNISSFNYFSKKIIILLKKILNKNYKKIIIPFEGQPFQNEIIKFFKNKNKRTLITGYIHSPPASSNKLYTQAIFSR